MLHSRLESEHATAFALIHIHSPHDGSFVTVTYVAVRHWSSVWCAWWLQLCSFRELFRGRFTDDEASFLLLRFQGDVQETINFVLHSQSLDVSVISVCYCRTCWLSRAVENASSSCSVFWSELFSRAKKCGQEHAEYVTSICTRWWVIGRQRQ